MRKAAFLHERGATLVELLVSLAVVGVVFAAMSDSLFFRSGTLSDQAQISAAESTAQSLRDMLAFDLRMLGAGMPLTQSSFMNGGAATADARLPVLLDADNDRIEFRLNDSGLSSVLTSAYTPSASSLSFDLVSATGFRSGDTIYLSNMLGGGSSGLQAVVESVSGNRVRIRSGFRADTGATFGAGSSADRISRYRFVSPADWSGITRDTGNGAVLLAPNSAFTIEYLDSARASIPLPLSEAEVMSQLGYLRLTVFARPLRALKNHAPYQAEASQLVALRSLRLSR